MFFFEYFREKELQHTKRCLEGLEMLAIIHKSLQETITVQ